MKINRSELIQLANKYIGNHSLEAQNQIMLKIAVARCARVSYTVVGEEKEFGYDKQIELHDKLTTSGHWSPFEHCAKVMTSDEYNTFIKGKVHHVNSFMGNFDVKDDSTKGWCYNYRGFIQYRYLLENNQSII